MTSQFTTRTIDALRATLVQVEQRTGLAPDDPSLGTLKRILLQRIADLEAAAYSSEVTESADRAVIGTALELAVSPSTDESASSMAINLAVSLLAAQPSMHPLETADSAPVLAPAVLAPAVPDLPPVSESVMPELRDVAEQSAPEKLSQGRTSLD